MVGMDAMVEIAAWLGFVAGLGCGYVLFGRGNP